MITEKCPFCLSVDIKYREIKKIWMCNACDEDFIEPLVVEDYTESEIEEPICINKKTSDLFISYAHADNHNGWIKDFVKKLELEFEEVCQRDLNVFFDENSLRHGDDWAGSIADNVASSKHFIVFVSPNYFKSEWCRNEWKKWIETEIADHLLNVGISPIQIIPVEGLFDKLNLTPYEIAEQFANDAGKPDDLQLKSAISKHIHELKNRHVDSKRYSMHGKYPKPIEELHKLGLKETLNDLSKQLDVREEMSLLAHQSDKRSTVLAYNPKFTGRLDDLMKIYYTLVDKAVGVTAIIQGLGGIGKSELAYTYSHAYAHAYTGGRFIVRCEGRESLKEAILYQARGEAKVGIFEGLTDEDFKDDEICYGKIKTNIKQTLYEDDFKGKKRILLVLDNVDDMDILDNTHSAELKKLGPNLHILATSRQAPPPNIDRVELDPMKIDDSLELLRKFKPFKDGSKEANAALQICERLGGFTLAIELTGAYLEVNTDEDYQYRLKRLGLDELEEIGEQKQGKLHLHNEERMLSSIMKPLVESLSEEALLVVRYAAFMPSDMLAIPWLKHLLYEVYPHYIEEEEEGKNNFTKVLNELSRLSVLMCESKDAKTGRMHRLLQDWIKNQFTEGEQAEYIEKLCELSIVRMGELTDTPDCQNLLKKRLQDLCISINWKNDQWEILFILDLSPLMIDDGRLLPLELLDAAVKFTEMIKNYLPTNKILQFSQVIHKNIERCWELKATKYDIKYLVKSEDNVHYRIISEDTKEKLINKIQEEPQDSLFKIGALLCHSYLYIGEKSEKVNNLKYALENYKTGLFLHHILERNIFFAFPPEERMKRRSIKVNYAYSDMQKHIDEMEKSSNAKTSIHYDEVQKIRRLIPKSLQNHLLKGIFGLKMGSVFEKKGELNSAKREYKQALSTLLKELEISKDKIEEGVKMWLAQAYSKMIDVSEKLGDFRFANKYLEYYRSICKEIAVYEKHYDLELAHSFQHSGEISQKLGELSQMKEFFVGYYQISLELVDKNEMNMLYKLNFAKACRKMGIWFLHYSDVVQAGQYLKKNMKICEELSKMDKNNEEIKLELAIAYRVNGELQLLQGDEKRSLSNYCSSEQLLQELMEKYNDNEIISLELAFSKSKLGDYYCSKSKLEIALKYKKDAYQQIPDPHLERKDTNIQYILESCKILKKEGNIYMKLGNYNNAFKRYQLTIELMVICYDNSSEDMEISNELMISYWKIGKTCEKLKKYYEAIEYYKNGKKIQDQIKDNELIKFYYPTPLGFKSRLNALHCKSSLPNDTEYIPSHKDTIESQIINGIEYSRYLIGGINMISPKERIEYSIGDKHDIGINSNSPENINSKILSISINMSLAKYLEKSLDKESAIEIYLKIIKMLADLHSKNPDNFEFYSMLGAANVKLAERYKAVSIFGTGSPPHFREKAKMHYSKALKIFQDLHKQYKIEQCGRWINDILEKIKSIR